MNIDEKTLAIYKNEKSSFSTALNEGINFNKSCFKVDKKLRCAFLGDNGLCEIIMNLGEQGLCQVCRDHPRFRNYFNDRVEMGLGFCCEQASKVILSFEEKIQPVLISELNEGERLDFIQESILAFRNKALAVIQDRSVNIMQRIKNLLTLSNAQITQKDFKKTTKTFLSFERLTKGWTKRLKSVKHKGFIHNLNEETSCFCEQFLVNSLYRYLGDAEDTMWARARAIASVLAWSIISNIFEREQSTSIDNFDLLVDIIREYSAEVEYSQKNLDKLFSLAYKLIKI